MEKIELITLPTVDAPKHILARLGLLSSHYGYSVKAIMLAGVLNAIEEGNRALPYANSFEHHDFKFKLMLADTVKSAANDVSATAETTAQREVSADNIISEYINAHSGCFTHYNAADKSNRWGKDELARGAIAGRYTEEQNGDMKIAVLWGRLLEFAAERDLGSRALLKWAEGKGGKITTARLAPNAMPQKCLVMPIEKEQIVNSSIDTGANLNDKAENHSQ